MENGTRMEGRAAADERLEMLHLIRKHFVEHGFSMRAVHENGSYVGSSARGRNISFFIHVNADGSYLKWCNENEQENRAWFETRLLALKAIIPGSVIHESEAIPGRFWFNVPLDNAHNPADILRIVEDTRKTMGY